MNIIRRLILALALSSGLAPAFAQVAPPVPALPDTERRTTYSISASTCACNVNFALYGDSTDYANWIEVFVNGVRMAQAGNWTLSSATGTIGSIPLPITNAVLTFTAPQTGTIQIVGARRPRRTSQFNEGAGVPTRNFNVVLSDLTAQLRENWDKTNDVTGRAILATPGETLALLPLLANRKNLGACFDNNGNLATCASVPSSTFAAGNGIIFSGVNPTTVTNNIAAGPGVTITGTNPLTISSSLIGPGSIFITPAASGSSSSTTGTMTSASPTLTLAAAIDFANGQGIRVNHAGAAFTLNPPTSGTVTPQGTPGGTAYAYTIASLNATGGVGQSITNITTATGNASLSSINFNRIAWTAASGGATAYAVYGRTAGGLVLLTVTSAVTFDDIGGAAASAPDWLPTTPQTSASLASWLITTISSGGGSTTLTLGANATTNATTQTAIHDDTVALQAAFTAAQTAGIPVFISQGIYLTTSALTATGKLRIIGAGYAGDSGGGFAGHGVTTCSGLTGAVICAGILNNGIVATTNQSVQIEGFQISYPLPAVSGITDITIQAVAGAGNANTQSSIRNMMLTGGDIGVTLTNCLNFTFTGNHILYQTTYAEVVNSPNFPSFQQASISDNIFWGAATTGYAAHLLVQAGGDLRITNNKFSTGGVNTSSIALFGASSGSQNMEPMVISGNSSEGAQNCITFNTANASFTASQIVITGNQLWCGGKSILINTFGVSQWVIGVTITGNVLTVNGGASVTNMSFDNLKNSTIVGNTFNCSGGCSTSTGIALASHTTGIVIGNNTYDAGYTTKISNLAASGLNSQTDVACPPIPKVFTSGTNATFTLDTCVGNLPQYLEIELQGAGGGGAGSGTTPGAATAGGATCFNTSSPACTTPVYQAGGGALGTVTPGAPVAGGTVSGSGTCDDSIAGAGAASGSNQANSFGGAGGSSPYGGAGAPGFAVAAGGAATNSGSGGGGAGENATTNAGGGGAAGAWCRVRLSSPAASYFYTIGPAGAAGTAGTGGAAGGAGGAGRFKAMERWSFLSSPINDNALLNAVA